TPAPPRERPARAMLRRGWRALPAPVRRVVRRALGGGDGPASTPDPGPWHARVSDGDQASRCFPLMNGLAVSGIRVNLRGREPGGLVEPGAEREAFEASLAADLLAITDERTGGPLVRRVLRTRDLYAGEHLDILPDLLVEGDGTVGTGNTHVGGGRGATVRARSPKVGLARGAKRA